MGIILHLILKQLKAVILFLSPSNGPVIWGPHPKSG